MPIPCSSEGEWVPLVTTPASAPSGPITRVALARDPPPGQDERRELLCRALGAGGGDRLRADEPRLLLAAPAEPGLDRVAVLGQVVAVEVEADLEAQRVAGAEPGRHGAAPRAARSRALRRVRAGRGSRPRPRRCSPCRRRGTPPPATAIVAVCIRAGSSPSAMPGDDPARVRALHRQHRPVGEAVGDLAVELAGVIAEPGEVALVVGGVGDGQVALDRRAGT